MTSDPATLRTRIAPRRDLGRRGRPLPRQVTLQRPGRARVLVPRLCGQGPRRGRADAMPEPFLGPLTGRPEMVFLALNPGRASPSSAATARSPTASASWAPTPPGRRPGPTSTATGRRPGSARTATTRRGCASCAAGWAMITPGRRDGRLRAVSLALDPRDGQDEARPRHRPRVRVGADRRVGAPLVFAFGAPWFPLLTEQLGLTVVRRLGKEGDDYGSAWPAARCSCSRSRRHHSGSRQAVGSAAPPSAEETQRLREAVTTTLSR